jgi:hypothetical protein
MEPFPLGKVTIKQHAAHVMALAGQDADFFLNMHARGIWGDGDAEGNDQSSRDGSMIVSRYHTLKGDRIMVITFSDRSETVLFSPPDDVLDSNSLCEPGAEDDFSFVGDYTLCESDSDGRKEPEEMNDQPINPVASDSVAEPDAEHAQLKLFKNQPADPYSGYDYSSLENYTLCELPLEPDRHPDEMDDHFRAHSPLGSYTLADYDHQPVKAIDPVDCVTNMIYDTVPFSERTKPAPSPSDPMNSQPASVIVVDDMGGWAKVSASKIAVPDNLPELLARTLAEWLRVRPQFRLISVVPVNRNGATVELHAWYERYV